MKLVVVTAAGALALPAAPSEQERDSHAMAQKARPQHSPADEGPEVVVEYPAKGAMVEQVDAVSQAKRPLLVLQHPWKKRAPQPREGHYVHSPVVYAALAVALAWEHHSHP